MCGTERGYAATPGGVGGGLRYLDVVQTGRGGGAVHAGTGLRACYAVSGTGLAYAAIGLRACYAVSGTDLAYAARRRRRDGVSWYAPLSAYVRARRCPRMVLRDVAVLCHGIVPRDLGYCASVWCYAVCGTERAYGATRALVWGYALRGTERVYGARGGSGLVAAAPYPPPLRSGPISPRASYAMSGTDLAYAAMRCPRGAQASSTRHSFAGGPGTAPISLRAPTPCPGCATCGTDLGPATVPPPSCTRAPVSRYKVRYLPTHMLCDVRYRCSICGYQPMECPVLTRAICLRALAALHGTATAYGPIGLCTVQYWHRVCCCARATRCPVLN
eukprot:2484367-Rhodomonas_salina.2